MCRKPNEKRKKVHIPDQIWLVSAALVIGAIKVSPYGISPAKSWGPSNRRACWLLLLRGFHPWSAPNWSTLRVPIISLEYYRGNDKRKVGDSENESEVVFCAW